MATPQHRPHTFNELMDSVATLASADHDDGDDKVRISSILHVVGHRSFGPALLLVGLFSISPATMLPGATWFAATLTLLLSLQLVFGSRYPWLPARILSTGVSRASLYAATSDGLRTWARRLDGLLKPRYVFLSQPPFANLAGIICVAAALVTFPLGLIPVAPIIPGLAITLVGVGLFARDGLLLLVGAAIVSGAVWFAIATLS